MSALRFSISIGVTIAACSVLPWPAASDAIINSGSCVINIIGNSNVVNANGLCSAEQQRVAQTFADVYFENRKKEAAAVGVIDFIGPQNAECKRYKTEQELERWQSAYLDPHGGATSNAKINVHSLGMSAVITDPEYELNLDMYEGQEGADLDKAIDNWKVISSARISWIQRLKESARAIGCIR